MVMPLGGLNKSFPRNSKERSKLAALLLALLLVLILFGVGFTSHLLWIVAVVALVLLLLGLVVRPGGGRWYYW